MPTLYGESTVYSYEAQGGIAVMSADSPDPGTVSGGSGGDESGEVGVPTRILWSITYDGTNYTGGITATKFYFDAIQVVDMWGEQTQIYGPFYGWNAADLYQHAVNNGGHLNDVFLAWNTGEHSSSVSSFVTYLEHELPSCVNRGQVGG